MNISSHSRPSSSPYAASITHGRTLSSASIMRPAEMNWHMVLSSREGITEFLVVGPWSRANRLIFEAGAEVLWIRLQLGVYMPHLPTKQIRDSETALPAGAFDTFYLKGRVWQHPTYENADTFLDHLIRDNLLNLDPVVGAALQGHPAERSPRTVRQHFLHATGLSQQRITQIERAQRAAGLLRGGMPILDVVHALGYYDQPHLTRAVKAFVGYTPGQLRAATSYNTR